MGKLFGTDGIRGKANQDPMTAELAVRVGRAVAVFFKRNQGRSKIVIGKDTRISGDMLESALVSGICSMGSDAYLAGVLPTPGVAVLTASTAADAGIVISASHNPFYDNGIKIFNGKGYKLSDQQENEIEKLIGDEEIILLSQGVQETGRVYNIEDAVNRYAAFLIGCMPTGYSLKKFKVVMDCSNGATFRVAPFVFNRFEAQVDLLFDNPDGKNINQNCGSQHPEILVKAVLDNKANVGLAFDGDGDRLIAVDENGKIISGDQIIAICAKYMKHKGRLTNNRVVSTIMSNMGLGAALKSMGVMHSTTNVGDRYVMEEMIASGAVLGGEDSGHLIFLDHHTTGDGILAALNLTEIMHEASKPLSELCKVMTIFPQVLKNIDVRHKPELETVPEIKNIISWAEQKLGAEGRVLVRYSGTQPKCRVMVEGPTKEETERYCQKIAEIVKKELGN